MLPYVHVDDLSLLGIKIHPFGLLVALAVIAGVELTKRRARRLGLNVEMLDSFIGWMLLLGFTSAHALDEILYRPHEVIARPWTLLYFWEGIGSFSGWLGALAGVVLWRRYEWRAVRKFGPFTLSRLAKRKTALPIMPFADVILSVFPVAWVLGRGGCSVVHDHPGVRAEDGAPLAVAFPSPDPSVIDGPGAHSSWGPVTLIDGNYARYDLGTLELLFTACVAIVFVVFLWRRRLTTGTYAAIVCLVYAPVRFLMEFLRLPDRDPRYLGLTPAQWISIAMFAGGIALVRRVLAIRARGEDPIPAALLAQPTPNPSG